MMWQWQLQRGERGAASQNRKESCDKDYREAEILGSTENQRSDLARGGDPEEHAAPEHHSSR